MLFRLLILFGIYYYFYHYLGIQTLDQVEAFVFGKYLRAHDDMKREELLLINGSTELAYKAGLKCLMVTGDPMNFKITTPEDLSNFESIISSETK